VTLVALPVPATDADPDLAFVRAMARGDETALEALYRRHGSALLAYLAVQLADRGLAEEVLQDVMLAAWHAAAAFRGDSRTRTWLFCIAHNRAVNARRRKVLPIVHLDASRLADDAESRAESRAERVLPGTAPGRSWHADLPADAMRDRRTGHDGGDHGLAARTIDLQVDVSAALSILSADQRAAVDLFFVHGLSIDDIALVLAVPPGTVKSRLHRARAALRERLEALP
jgi:RNA polymerase sigma factor (sigma-70 family)